MMKSGGSLLYAAIMTILAAAIPARASDSIICRLERIATAEVEETGKLVSGGDTSMGELVISRLNSDAPVASGNFSSETLRVLKRTKDMVWLVDTSANESVELLTVFLKSGLVMYTKHETLRTLTGKEAPLGFVEIGKCRALQ